MRELPLYESTPLAAIEFEEPRKPNPDCQLCSLFKGVRSPCIRAAGDVGGALLVVDHPGVFEDRVGVPLSGPTGSYLKSLIRQTSWDKPVAVDNAIRCCPGTRTADNKHADLCRGYLASTLRAVKPTRILAMGPRAVYGVLGRAVPLMSARRGYGWLYNLDVNASGEPIPVFELLDPTKARKNRFLKQMFEADFQWALSCTAPEPPPWEGVYYLVESVADSEEACHALCRGDWFAYDTETVGIQYKDDFRVIALSACAKGTSKVFVWDIDALYSSAIFAPLAAILEDKRIGKLGQNLKYDAHAVDCAFGIELQNYAGDTRLWRRLLAADVTASLDVMAELVGLGGIKKEAQTALAAAGRALAKERKKFAEDPIGQTNLLKLENPIILSACQHPDVGAKTYTYGLIDKTMMLRYNARDTLTTVRDGELLEARLANMPPLKRVWDLIVKDANHAIKTIEGWGIPSSLERAELFRSHLETKMDVIQQHFEQYPDFKPNSPASVGALLYGELGLQAPKKTKSGKAATDHETLKLLKGQHQVVDELLEWRRLTKLHGFAKGIVSHICPDGRIHPSIKIDGTRTGRLSCVAQGTPVEVVRDVSQYPDGVPIESVQVGDLAYTFDIDNKLTLRRVNRVVYNGVREVVRVHWRGQGGYSTGYVDLTADHRVRLFDGTYKCAGDLVKEDRVCAISRGLNAYGYARLWATHTGEIREHKFIYKHCYGDLSAHIHHCDGNKLNNVPTNLIGMTASEHLSYHGKHIPDSLRKKRSIRMKQQIIDGRITWQSGKDSAHYRPLTRDEATRLLNANSWSITLAARAGKWDFDTFKRHLVELGFDCVQIKQRSRQARRDSILRAAALARSARCGHNHGITSVERIGKFVDVYDLEIEGTHNFVAGGIAVHNCENPNLQNISRPKDEDAKQARDLFVAHDGYEFLELDYSQLELRVATMLCQDPKMLNIWQSGVDYHKRTAQMISKIAWGIPPEDVQSEHRSAAKCFHPDTEVLTRRGWVKIVDLTGLEEVVQAVPRDNCEVDLEWVVPNEIFTKKHPAKQLIHLESEGIDLSVTPDHRMLVWGRSNGKAKDVLAESFVGHHTYFANGGNLAGYEYVRECRLRLAVAIQADGYITQDGAVRFAFTRPRKMARLEKLLLDAGVQYTRSFTVMNGKSAKSYYISRDECAPVLALLDGKRFSWSWLSLIDDLRRAIVDEASYWDAHRGANWRMYRYDSREERNVDVLQALASSVGLKTRKVCDGCDYHLSVKAHGYTQVSGVRETRVCFTDEVACLSVPSTYVLVRSNGIPVITGQTVNFGVIYGMKAPTLAKRIGCSVDQASKIMAAISGEFEVFAQWCREQLALARRTGYVWTWWDGEKARRRPLWDVASPEDRSRSNAENGAVNCLDSETEALTQRGWVKGFDLQMCDRIMTKNPTTGELEWQSPTDLRFFPDYEGELYEFKSRSFHAITTPDHRWLVRDKNSGNDIEKTTKNISLHGDHRIHRTGEFSGEGVSLYSDDFIRLVGWWLTDGYRKRTRKVLDRLGKRGPKPTKQRIGLTQSCRANLEKVRMIFALLERLQINPTIRDIEWSKCRQWEWSDKYSKKLVELFPSRELTTEFVFMLGRRQAEILLETMMLGDGHNGHKRTFVSGSAKQAEAFQALAVLCGIASSIIKRDMRKYTPKSSKLWKGQSPHGTSHWQVILLRRDKVQVLGRQCKRFRAKASVWCPVVPNTFFVARRSGHVFITGNTPVQGTASDFCLASIGVLIKWLLSSTLPAELVLTVHDSVMFHARSDVIDEVGIRAHKIMTKWNSGGVPLVVDAKRGTAWGSLKDYKLVT